MQSFGEYARFYDLIYKKKPYAEEARNIWEWAGRPIRILEIGCGTGRHAREWCRYANVVGIDPSAEMLKRAYRNKRITYKRGVLSSFEWTRNYPAVFAMFNVIGYMGDLVDTLVRLPLKKGGVFIFDAWHTDEDAKVTIFEGRGFLRFIIPVGGYSYRVIIAKENKIVVDEIHRILPMPELYVRTVAEDCGYCVDEVRNSSGWTKWYKLRRK